MNFELNPKSILVPSGNHIGKLVQDREDSEAAADDVFAVPTEYLLDFNIQMSELSILMDITHSAIGDTPIHKIFSPFNTLSTFHTFPDGTVELVLINLT
jgi:hypothetical protein